MIKFTRCLFCISTIVVSANFAHAQITVQSLSATIFDAGINVGDANQSVNQYTTDPSQNSIFSTPLGITFGSATVSSGNYDYNFDGTSISGYGSDSETIEGDNVNDSSYVGLTVSFSVLTAAEYTFAGQIFAADTGNSEHTISYLSYPASELQFNAAGVDLNNVGSVSEDILLQPGSYSITAYTATVDRGNGNETGGVYGSYGFSLEPVAAIPESSNFGLIAAIVCAAFSMLSMSFKKIKPDQNHIDINGKENLMGTLS